MSLKLLEQAFTAMQDLRKIPGVDGAKLHHMGSTGLTIRVFAKEHGIVDRDQLLLIEDEISLSLGIPVQVTVVAHQGRDWRQL